MTTSWEPGKALTNELNPRWAYVFLSRSEWLCQDLDYHQFGLKGLTGAKLYESRDCCDVTGFSPLLTLCAISPSFPVTERETRPAVSPLSWIPIRGEGRCFPLYGRSTTTPESSHPLKIQNFPFPTITNIRSLDSSIWKSFLGRSSRTRYRVEGLTPRASLFLALIHPGPDWLHALD